MMNATSCSSITRREPITPPDDGGAAADVVSWVLGGGAVATDAADIFEGRETRNVGESNEGLKKHRFDVWCC